MITSQKLRPSLSALLLLALLAASARLHAQSTGLVVTSSNNVGIGTTSPDLKFQVNVGSAATYGLGVYNTNDNVKILFGTTTGSYLNIQGKTINTNAPYKIALQAEGGNVGIGTTNPGYKLDVYDSESSGTVMNLNSSLNGTSDWGIRFGINKGFIGFRSFAVNGGGVGDMGIAPGPGGNLLFGYNGGYEAMRINTSGNVGIGTTSPEAKLHINGAGGTLPGTATIELSDENSRSSRRWSISNGAGGNSTDLIGKLVFSVGSGSYTANPMQGTAAMVINSSGCVGIGTTTPSYMLDVAGSVHATSFVSSTQTYADFVFKPDYKLAPLSDVETAIKKDGHLPGIPSAEEAKAHGIDLAQMQVKLLQKIEELTLHQIEQEKKLSGQQDQLADQQKRLDAQAQRIGQLEKENTELRTAR